MSELIALLAVHYHKSKNELTKQETETISTPRAVVLNVKLMLRIILVTRP